MLLISLLPVGCVTGYSIYSISDTMKERSINDSKSSILWLQNKLSDTIISYTQNFLEFETDTDFRSSILAWNASPDTTTFPQKEIIINKLNGVLSINPNIAAAVIFGVSNRSKISVVPTGAYFTYTGNDPASVYGRKTGLQTNFYFLPDQAGPHLVHAMFDKNGVLSAYATLTLRSDYLKQTMQEVKLAETDGVVLLNDDNAVIDSEVSTSFASLPSDVTTLAEQNALVTLKDGTLKNDHFWFYRSVENGKLQIAETLSTSEIRKAQWNALIVGIIAASLAALAVVLLSVLSSRLISKPIIELANKMKDSDVTKGPQVQETRHDEIGTLQHNFNEMSGKISELIDKEYKGQLATRDAELRAMQSQINPHFVYNTLQVIGGMALQRGEKDIYSMTTSFSDILRYSLNFDHDIVPLSEEIKYLESYISIQNQRFPGKILFVSHIPTEEMEDFVPKLILQPLLENSFKHGLPEKRGEWAIELIGSREGNDLLLKMNDNGIGMSKEQLTTLQEEFESNPDKSLRSGEHIGLANVNLRLRLLYGGHHYGVSIDSVQGQGTSVTLRLRIERNEHDKI